MHLKSLELIGFKSFAKKSEFKFDSSIVGIVGPNGSGKSNVAEAFRFALGEQSFKSMRGKRGEDLIFNGSKSLSKINRASVRLTFDNSDKFFDIDFEEVVIERVVYRDGSNEYILNGSKVRLKDIVELLAKANIGASGHHIISQGEADRILNASIKERKEMIEDALGLKIYQYKKEESERKLEKTTLNISQVESLRKEISPHMRFLEKQVEKVEKAKGLKDELIVSYKEYLRREEEYISFSKKQIKEDKEGPAKEKEALEKRISELKEILESEGEEGENKKVLDIEKELRVLDDSYDEVRRDSSKLEGLILSEEKNLERIIKEEKKSYVNIDISDIENILIEGEKAEKLASKEIDASLLRKLLGDFIGKIKTFINERKSNQGSESKKEIEEELKKLKEKKKVIDSKEKEILESKKSVRERYESLRKRIEENRVKGRVAEREMFNLLNRRTELATLLQSISTKENQITKDEKAFKNELLEAQALGGLNAIRYKDVELTESFYKEERSAQEERKKKLEKIKIKLEESGFSQGEDILKEYEEVKGRDKFLSKEIEDLNISAQKLKELIGELSEKLNSEFQNGVEKINNEFQNLFSLMFGGGEASLYLVKRDIRKRKVGDDDLEYENPEELQEDGIEINVSLPNKRIKGLQMLSGGERALTSIALLFAISQVNPPPFVILDETDAALDEANSRKYGDMIESLSKHSQLILITHNRETMSRAGILYGVTMGGEGVSKLLSVKFDEAVLVAK